LEAENSDLFSSPPSQQKNSVYNMWFGP